MADRVPTSQYRELLVASGQTFSKPVGQLSTSYVRQLGADYQRSVAEGRPFSRQAARGHYQTPERIGRAAPAIAARPELARPARVPRSFQRLANNVFRAPSLRRKAQAQRALRGFEAAGRPSSMRAPRGGPRVQIAGRFK